MVDTRFDYSAALAGCARGDSAALQKLFHQEAPCMLALANIMLNDQSAAQDAVHDTFVLIWKNAASYDAQSGSARAWMHSIMRYRTKILLQQRPPLVANAVIPAIQTAAETAPGLAGALALQSDELRKPVYMAFFNGLSYSGLAAKLGRTTAQVRNNVRSSLRALQEHTLT